MKKLPLDARVWVYQSNRILTDLDKQTIFSASKQFVSEWAAHGTSLQSDVEVIDDYFLVLAVDENIASASGCSIDSSVKFVKAIGNELNIDFFNRLNVVVTNGVETKLISFHDLEAYKTYKVYNPLVNTIQQLNENFLLEVIESDFYKMLVG